MLVAEDAVLRRDVRELAPANHPPVLPERRPVRQRTGRLEGILPRSLAVLAVVRDEHAPEAGAEPLRMIAGHMRLRRRVPAIGPRHVFTLQQLGDLPVVLAVLADERADVERPHVELVKPSLHRRYIDLVRGIR